MIKIKNVDTQAMPVFHLVNNNDIGSIRNTFRLRKIKKILSFLWFILFFYVSFLFSTFFFLFVLFSFQYFLLSFLSKYLFVLCLFAYSRKLK